MEKSDKVPYIPSQVGIVYVWGKGLDGQLGLGSKMNDEPFPQEVITLSKAKIRTIACGGSFTVAISENGDCFTWGSSQAGQLGHNSSAPEPLPKIASEIHGLNIRDIQCGTSHTILLNDAQKVYSLGNNSSGQCGVVSVSNIFSPRVLQSLYKIDIIKLACGASHTLLLTAKGNVWSFGNNEFGQLGTGDCKDITVAKQIKELKNISEIACGSSHSAVVDVSGNVYSFGKGKNGQLGLGVNTTKNTRLVTPTKIEFFVDRKIKIVSIALGDDHSLALDSRNQLWSWGSSKDGQCGHGDREEYHVPAMVALDKQFVKIASGPRHCAALTENGQLYTWGSGYQYKLGHGTTGDELIPRLVSRLTELCVKSVSCGLHHTVALVNKLPSLSNDLRNLLNSPNYSDIVIVVQEQKIYAHKCILSRCKKFESKVQDVKEISIENSKYNVFLSLVEFIYTDDTHVNSESIDDLFSLAIEYELPRLQDICQCLKKNNSEALRSTIVSDMKSLLVNEKFAEISFLVEDKLIKAHKCILASRSSYFKMMFGSGMKEDTSSESIPIVDISPPIFQQLLEFIYTGECNLHSENIIELYMSSNQYRLSDLKQLCESFIQDNLEVSNVIEILTIAQFYNSVILKTKCIEYAQKLYEMVKKEEGYAKLDPQLKAEIERPHKKEPEIHFMPSVLKLRESEAIAESSVRSVLRPNNKFKLFLQKARVDKNMSRRQLAFAIQEKEFVITAYENGTSLPRKEVLQKMEKVLKTDLLTAFQKMIVEAEPNEENNAEDDEEEEEEEYYSDDEEEDL